MYDNTLQATSRTTQIDEWLDKVEREIQTISELGAELDMRLRRITRENTPNGAGLAPAPPEPLLVPIAERLRSSAKQLVTINNCFRDLIERIEL